MKDRQREREKEREREREREGGRERKKEKDGERDSEAAIEREKLTRETLIIQLKTAICVFTNGQTYPATYKAGFACIILIKYLH